VNSNPEPFNTAETQSITGKTLSELDSGIPRQTQDIPTVVARRFGFKIGDTHLLVHQGVFSELLVDIQVSPLPNTPEHVEGLANLRGNIVPVYSLTHLIKMEHSKSKLAFLIGPPENGAAIVINDKPILVELDDTPKQDVSGDDHPLSFCLDGYYVIGSTRWYSLDQDALFQRLSTPLLGAG